MYSSRREARKKSRLRLREDRRRPCTVVEHPEKFYLQVKQNGKSSYHRISLEIERSRVWLSGRVGRVAGLVDQRNVRIVGFAHSIRPQVIDQILHYVHIVRTDVVKRNCIIRTTIHALFKRKKIFLLEFYFD